MKTFAAIAVVLGMLLACMLISPKYAQAASYDLSGDNRGWVVGTGEQGSQVQFSTDGGQTWRNYTDGMTLDYGTQVRVKLSWKVPNEVKVQQGTTFTYDLPQGIAFENGATYPMYDSTGKQRGTFTVQDNKVVATYTDTTDASSGINAYVTIDGKITRSADNNGNGGKRDWNFPGIGNVETTINPEHGLDIHKNGAVNTGETDADGNSVYYYVLNVGSTGPNTNVTITDTMGELLTLVPDSFELFTDADLTTEYGKSDWHVTSSADGKGFALTIPSMGDGEKLYVKYKVKVSRQQVIAACKASADATAQCENGNLDVTDNKVTIKSNKSTEKTDHKGLVFKSKWTVNKRGSADGDQHDINWNIELIPGDDSNTRNTMVKDLLGEGMEPPTGDVTIECYGKDNKYWPVQKTVKIKWADLVNGTATLPEGYGRYVITYTTPIANADSTTQTTYTNTVDGKDGDGNNFNGTGTVTIDRTEGDIAKRTLSGASATSPIQWETTFTAKKDLDGATITDTVDQNCSGKKVDGSDNCTATGDWQTMNHDVKVYTDAAHTKEYPASNYQIKYANGNKSFTLTVTRGLAKGDKLYIVYSTTVKDGAPSTIYNTAAFGKSTKTATHTGTNDNMDKGVDWESDATNGKYGWTLSVHDVASGAKDVTITDTLPANMEYIPGSMTVRNQSGAALDGVSVTSHPSKDGQDTLTFTFKNPSAALTEAKHDGGRVQIGYLTRLKDVKAFAGSSEFRNSAVISVDGVAQIPDQASRWIDPPQLVNKKSTYTAATAPYINYTIDVNSAGSTLNGGQTLVLKDTLPEAVELQQGSVRIVDPKTQGEIQGAASFYDPATRVLTINVPDATPARVTYKAVVLLQPGQSLDGLAVNTVTLVGYENKGGSSQDSQTGTVHEAKGGFTDSPHSLQIFKYGDGDAGGRGLGDAVFRVDELAVNDDGSSKAWSSTVSTNVTKTLASGTDGYTKYVGLKANRIYKVTEVQAPEGYEISSKPLYVVFPSTDAYHGHLADHYEGVTVDGQPLTVAAVNGQPQSLYLWMVNDKQDVKAKVAISKVEYGHADIAVKGATLSLVSDSDNREISRWTTDGDAKSFDLVPGSYTLTELSAPNGYRVADVMRIVVSNNGEVTVNGSRPPVSDGAAQVQMQDKPDTTAVKVSKAWNDGDNQDGLRGDVTFKLWKLVDGRSTDMNLDKTLKAGQSTEVGWENLPVKDGGKDVHYYVTEVSTLDGYTSTCERQKTDGTWEACMSDYSDSTQYRFTNKHTPETTQVAIRKVWKDNDDSERLRPANVTVQLQKDGKPVEGQTVTLNAGNNWSDSFTDLPKYANGRQIAYTVKEVQVQQGYSVAIVSNATKNGTFSYTVTNTHTPTSGEVLISKRDVGGTEIKGATLELTGVTSNGQKFGPIEWTSGDSPHSVRLENGTYTLTETKAPNGYLPSSSIKFTVTMNSDGTKAIVKIVSNDNTVDPDETSTVVMVDEYKTTTVKVSKVSLTDGVGEIAGAKLTVTGTTIGGEAITPISWTSGEEELTKDGEIIPKELTLAPGTYTLHESEVPEGYEPAQDIVFQVTVEGKVTILRNGNTIGDASLDGNHVTMVDSPSKTNVQFSKVEVGGSTELPGAEFRIEGTDFEGYDINPIVWTSGEAPHSVQLKDGKYTLTETKAPDGYRVSDPIRFAIKRGQAYHVSDSGEPTTPVDGNTVRVEDQRIKRLAISVTKRWSDNLNADKYRTPSVTVQLQQNGHPFGDRITLDSSNHWTTTWSELLATDDNGKTYSYTVNEIQDPDFAKKYHFTLQKRPLTDGYEFTMINIHKPDTIDLEATKHWDDADNQDGVRPDQVCVVVYGTSDQPKDDGSNQYEPVKEIMLKENCEQLTARKNWTMKASGLPKNNIYGKPYTYTVEETRLGYALTDADGKTTYTYKNVMDETDPAKVNADTKYEKPGYSYKTVKADGTAGNEPTDGCLSTGIATCKATITNKHTPETVSLSVTKHWDDADNQLGKRPKTLTFWVLSSIWKNGDSTQREYLPGWPTPQTATGECSKSVADYTTGLAGATGLTASGTAWGKSCIVLSKDGVAETSDGSSAVTGANDSGNTADTAANNADTAETWPSYTFENLPKYYKGQKIHYDVTESMPSRLVDRSNDYEATVKETTQNGTLAFDVTNRYRYVVLPETGGSGINSKPAAILIAISSICLIGACAMKTHENRKRHALGRSMR
ncbi:Cna B-type domain-containing protein [Bifidobacterium adolescentis]|uniref:Cna B-type domain-containing protein n=1 Tax=Bifidobacterium adolescentis TaxID=1680 RepID=UPI001EDD1DE6|nr:Cna B-type domain-containing protein [Bifidobacterium adolescentis]